MAVPRAAGTMPVSGEWIAITSPSTTLPRPNAGQRAPHLGGVDPVVRDAGRARLDRYGSGSIAAFGGNRSMPPVRKMIDSSASRSTASHASYAAAVSST